MHGTKLNLVENSNRLLKIQTIPVLLVDGSPSRAALLKRALEECGYTIVRHLQVADSLADHAENCAAQLVIVGIDLPDDTTLNALAHLHGVYPLPVIMFAEKDTPAIINRVIKAGISAFIVDDLQPQRLTSIIAVALARFSENQSLRHELQQTKAKLAQRKVLDRAKGMLMQQKGLNEDEAYRCLRKLSMDKGQPLAKVAADIIDLLQIFEQPALNNNA